MAHFSHMSFMTLEDYREDIIRFLRENRAFTDNLIRLTLRQVEHQYGRDAAHLLIDDFELKQKFGIRKKTAKST